MTNESMRETLPSKSEELYADYTDAFYDYSDALYLAGHNGPWNALKRGVKKITRNYAQHDVNVSKLFLRAAISASETDFQSRKDEIQLEAFLDATSEGVEINVPETGVFRILSGVVEVEEPKPDPLKKAQNDIESYRKNAAREHNEAYRSFLLAGALGGFALINGSGDTLTDIISGMELGISIFNAGVGFGSLNNASRYDALEAATQGAIVQHQLSQSPSATVSSEASVV